MNYPITGKISTKKISQTSSFLVYTERIVIIHLNTLASYMHDYIPCYIVNRATPQKSFYKNLCIPQKQAHVGNSGCLSSVPIRWLAWNDSQLRYKPYNTKWNNKSMFKSTTSYLHHQPHQQSYLQKKIQMTCERTSTLWGHTLYNP